MVSKIIIFVCIVGTASAATWIAKLPKKPAHLAHKEGCFIPEIKDVIPFNTDISPIGQCLRIDCGQHLIEFATCPVVSTDDPNCHITDTDLSKPYPSCCPDIKCDLDNSLF